MEMNLFGKIVLAISIVCLIFAIIYRIQMNRRTRAGDTGEKKRVSQKLHGIGKLRGFEVIDDAVLIDEGLSGWADHIVVGYFGVLLVYDICFAAEYSGKPEDEFWRVSVKGSVGKVKNPFPLAVPCTGRVNTLLKKHSIKVPVYRAAVLVGQGKIKSFIPSEDVVPAGKLGGYFQKSKFEEDRNVDVKKVAEILRAGLKAKE